MSDRLLAEALQARDPSALTSVYDAYSHQLYAYCWFRLSSREAAEAALRDTLVVAEAHIGRLRDRDRLGPWLYAIARLESGRFMAYGVRRPDVPVARHDQEDVDLRIAAWRAVMALPPLSREVLELRIRHGLSLPDLAAVLGLAARRVGDLLDQAHADLEAALTAEVLAREGPYDCPGRAEILRARRAELTVELRDRLLRHALACRLCGAHHPGPVSAEKVYGLLPVVSPPDSLRLRVMSCFLEPELIRYRFLIAVRAGRFDQEGFPVQPLRGPLWRRPGARAISPRRRVRARGAVPRRPAGARAAACRRPRAGRRDGALLGAAAVLMATGAAVSFVPLFRGDGSGTGGAPPAAAHPGPVLGSRPESRGPRPTGGPARGEALIVPEPVTVSLRSGDPAVWPLVMMSAPTADPGRAPVPRTRPPWTPPTREPPSPAPSTPSPTPAPSHTGPPPSGGPGPRPPSPAPGTKPPSPAPGTRPPSVPPPASPSPPASAPVSPSVPPSGTARTAEDPSAPGG
jgi:DNA-directed RNA polymerase specialized sigma24 family protein